jgi:hypothetical protein
MRDIETIDSELRLIAAVRRSIREHGIEPSSRHVDELLDERLAHRGPGRRGLTPAYVACDFKLTEQIIARRLVSLHRQGLLCLGRTGVEATALTHGINDEQDEAQSAQANGHQSGGEAVDNQRGDQVSEADDRRH